MLVKKHLYEGATSVYINNSGHMMTTMTIYVKNPSKIFFSGSGGLILTKRGMLHRGLECYNVYINYDPVLSFTYFTAGSSMQ